MDISRAHGHNRPALVRVAPIAVQVGKKQFLGLQPQQFAAEWRRSLNSVPCHTSALILGWLAGAEAVVYVELKHWKSASRKMSILGWSFAPIETLVDASSPPDDPGPRAGSPSISLILAL